MSLARHATPGDREAAIETLADAFDFNCTNVFSTSAPLVPLVWVVSASITHCAVPTPNNTFN
mgnify:CR=1 FL=1